MERYNQMQVVTAQSFKEAKMSTRSSGSLSKVTKIVGSCN